MLSCVDGSRRSLCCSVLMARDDLCVDGSRQSMCCPVLMARDDLCVVLC